MKTIKRQAAMISLVCCTTLSLNGCLPAAFVAGATAGGAIIYDKRSMKTMLRDRNMTQYATNRLSNDPTIKKNTNINVATFNGIMLMVGEAQTQALREQAQTIVNQTPHIKRLYDEVEIRKPSSLGTRIQSSLITSQVKAAMLASNGLKSTLIKVVTNKKSVYLMGLVSHKQADMAAESARKVTGVKKVVKVFEYQD